MSPPAPFNLPIAASILMLPETGPMAPYGLYEVLHAANGDQVTSDPSKGFEPRLLARNAGPYVTSIGIPLIPHRAIGPDERASIVIVCDAELGPDQTPKGRWTEEIAWLRAQRQQGAVICSVCSGALVLAEAGMLDGRTATSHWATAGMFRDFYPAVRFQPEHILCDSGGDGKLITSGGASSWQDLAIHLIGRFRGAKEAARVARMFVIGDRSDGQLPFASMAPPRRHDDRAIATAQAWIADNYGQPSPVSLMARQSGLQDRTFKRRFHRATGYTPLDYVQALRVEEAKQMLETSNLPVESVAEEVGYADAAHFFRLFNRLAGVSPAQWRRRYSTPRPAPSLTSGGRANSTAQV